MRNSKGVCNGGCLGLIPPWAWYLQNFITCAKEINCLHILFADLRQIPRNKYACKFQGHIVNGPKSNNYVLVGIRTIVCVQKPPHHFLQTLHPLRMFKIVFRDTTLYPKQLSLFCLLRLISANADRNGYISNFCSMIELLHELKQSLKKEN